ncbi:MAG: ComF family protein [Robiginitomaculum sp.]
MGIRKETISINLDTLVKQVPRAALNTILPPHSLISGLPINDEDSELWQAVKFLDNPCCDACGFPFEFDAGNDILCIRCQVARPRYDKARAAISYEEASRKIILDFKHGGRTDGLEFFSAQMQRAGCSFIAKSDFIVPVPLHKARLRARKFNQSALLARALSKRANLPYETSLLLRLKNTASQSGKSFVGRKRNVQGAFRLAVKKSAKLKGANVLLIDDVFTTGATLEACAHTLRRGGAAKIYALTLMRVVRPVSIAK